MAEIGQATLEKCARAYCFELFGTDKDYDSLPPFGKRAYQDTVVAILAAAGYAELKARVAELEGRRCETCDGWIDWRSLSGPPSPCEGYCDQDECAMQGNNCDHDFACNCWRAKEAMRND